MSGREIIGEVRNTQRRSEVEWIIGDFFSHAVVEDEEYRSPSFNIADYEWFLSIYPIRSLSRVVERISLLLCSETDSASKQVITGVSYRFGVKNADGSVVNVEENTHWVPEEDDVSLDSDYFLNTFEQNRRRCILVLSGALTITCQLAVHRTMDSSKGLETLRQNFADMLVNKTGCDVILKVEEEEFSAHKFVLQARSPVFRAMFQTDMKEKGVIDIPDCHSRAFKDFLTFLYSGKVEDLSNNAFDVYEIALKYDVEDLRTKCTLSIMGGISSDNVLDAVIFGDLYDEHGVGIKAQKFFNKNFSSIVTTAKWDSFLEKNCRLATKLLKEVAPKLQLRK